MRRFTGWTALVAIGFALVASRSAAQDLQLPQKNFTSYEQVNIHRDINSRGIPAVDLPAARKHFAIWAKYHADMISYPLLYKAAQDSTVKDPSGRPIPSLDAVIAELQRFIDDGSLEQMRRLQKPSERADYVREIGIALDAALKPIIETNADLIVRINATRMLAAACKSGATAHYPTVIELLKNANTPPEIRHYALLAAGNLLSAYDLFDVASRRHSNGWKDNPKGAGDQELGELVAAIEKHITDPATILPSVSASRKEPTKEQAAVISFIRRQAIWALGQVRFVSIPGPDGATPLYPAYTLARVCVSDPALGPPPSPAECAEAVIGICNMSNVKNGNPIKGYEASVAVEAATAGLITFIAPRASNVLDRSLPWRGYGLRLADALKNWRPLFDVGFNPLRPNVFAANQVPAEVETLYKQTQIMIFTPLEKLGFDGKPDPVGGRILNEELKTYLKQQQGNPRKPLFAGVQSTMLPAPPKP